MRNALDVLTKAQARFDPDLVHDVVEAVLRNDGHWPPHEPRRTFVRLVDSVSNVSDSDEELWRWYLAVLQAFLLELADQIYEGHTIFSHDVHLLVEGILSTLKGDLKYTRRKSTSASYRLALMLAANFSAIPSRKDRAAFVNLLQRLVKCRSGYDHPFLADLVLIYHKMNLKHLDKVLAKSEATR